jgi:hypothetical protein
MQSSSGNQSEAVLNVAFENNGGSMQFLSMMVRSVEVNVSFAENVEVTFRTCRSNRP